MIRSILIGLSLVSLTSAWAASDDTVSRQALSLSDQLIQIRKKMDAIQKDCFAHLKDQKNARIEIRKVQQLMQLQKRQKELVLKKIQDLETTMADLDSRKRQLDAKVQSQQSKVVRLMKTLEVSNREVKWVEPQSVALSLSGFEKAEAPRRRVISQLADLGLKELEVLRIDLGDLEGLESELQNEKQQIVYLSHEVQEQESVLALNRQLQLEILKKQKAQSLSQLESYSRLKSSESQVERLIGGFNARNELESVDHDVSFAKLRGKLPLPLEGGKVTSTFGKGYDPLSGLQIFKKGVEISGTRAQAVVAISSGRVAFSGELPNYGQVIIIDHGDHFYSLLGHLGVVLKKAKDQVNIGDSIGQTDSRGTPVYFEIRSRNVAVNPLQWVMN